MACSNMLGGPCPLPHGVIPLVFYWVHNKLKGPNIVKNEASVRVGLSVQIIHTQRIGLLTHNFFLHHEVGSWPIFSYFMDWEYSPHFSYITDWVHSSHFSTSQVGFQTPYLSTSWVGFMAHVFSTSRIGLMAHNFLLHSIGNQYLTNKIHISISNMSAIEIHSCLKMRRLAFICNFLFQVFVTAILFTFFFFFFFFFFSC